MRRMIEIGLVGREEEDDDDDHDDFRGLIIKQVILQGR